MTEYVSELGSIQPRTFFMGTEVPPLTTSVRVKIGQGVLSKGTLLGKVGAKIGAVTPGANTGAGTLTLFTVSKAAKVGNYVVSCVTVVSGGGIFSVVSPDGSRLADAVVGAAYVSDQVHFTLTDVGTDFAVGDKFTLAVVADNEYKLVAADAADGSAIASVVLAEESINTTAAAVEAVAYKQGIFNAASLSVAVGDTVSAHADELRLVNIFIKSEL
jgi:hypothetical protein